MKISLEHYDGEVVVFDNIPNDLDVHEIGERLERLLLAIGYHPESVKDMFLAKAEEYELEGKDGEE